MRLYFLRHGIAEDKDDWRGSDFERPLTDAGRKRMQCQAERIDDLDLGLDIIVTSPLVRARETAAIVADELGMATSVVEDGRLGLDFDMARLAEVIGEHRGAATMMVVGHEPSMSTTLGSMVGGARINLKKGGLACVDVADCASLDQATLRWLIPPKVLVN